jgi:hypothetical protein
MRILRLFSSILPESMNPKKSLISSSITKRRLPSMTQTLSFDLSIYLDNVERRKKRLANFLSE